MFLLFLFEKKKKRTRKIGPKNKSKHPLYLKLNSLANPHFCPLHQRLKKGCPHLPPKKGGTLLRRILEKKMMKRFFFFVKKAKKVKKIAGRQKSSNKTGVSSVHFSSLVNFSTPLHLLYILQQSRLCTWSHTHTPYTISYTRPFYYPHELDNPAYILKSSA